MDYLKKAHSETDAILDELENKLDRDYMSGYVQVNRLFLDLMKKHRKIFDEKLKELENGLITKKEYTDFLIKNFMLSKDWETVNEKLSEFYVFLNQKELNLINEKMSDIYAINYNAVQKAVKKEVI